MDIKSTMTRRASLPRWLLIVIVAGTLVAGYYVGQHLMFDFHFSTAWR